MAHAYPPRRIGAIRAAALAGLLAAGLSGPALAAPVITEIMAGSPPHAQADATVGIFGHGFASPLQVYFSDGVGPTVAATPVALDAERGIAVVRVPAGALTGNLKVTSNGSDSNLFFFRRDPGTFARGTSALSGQVTGPTLAPVPGAVVILMVPSGCDGQVGFWDHAITNAAGNYTLHGQPGGYMLFVFPPRSSGLASLAMPAAAPGSQGVVLAAGTTVQGRIVLASSPTTGVANARVDVEGDGYETDLTDANGYYSAAVVPGPYRLVVSPPPSAVLARSPDTDVTVGASNPQTMLDLPLAGGVRIYGTVRRASDATPMPGVGVSAWPQDGSGFQGRQTDSQGDGGYALVVPPGATYGVSTYLETAEPYADVRVDSVVVGASDVTQNLSLPDAGFIRGTITAASNGLPIADLQVEAYAAPWTIGGPVASTRTCEDGSYSLHVAPSVAGYVVATSPMNDGGFVPVAWRSPEEPALFLCEGTAVPVTSAGSVVGNVDLGVHAGAASIEGAVHSAISSCSASYGDFVAVVVDDGEEHACGLGAWDWAVPAGAYRITGLPDSSLLPVLRVCASMPGVGSVSCYNGESYPDFTPLSLSAGSNDSGVDLCVGEVQPSQEVNSLSLSKSGASFTMSWTPSSDPATVSYRVRGSLSARPGSLPGTFPTDPGFVEVWSGASAGVTLPVTTSQTFFLVTGIGGTGLEGPSGHYPVP